MTKLRCGGKYLRDFGQGRTDDLEKAHDFTRDEAFALQQLYPDYVFVAAEVNASGPSVLYGKEPPGFSPGEGRVWVKHRSCWLSIDRQEAFIGTRKALEASQKQMEIA